MKHCIIVKFNEKVNELDRVKLYDDIQQLFDHTTSIDGIHKVDLLKNIIDRKNRYDLIIEIQMEPSSLDAYDKCEWHHQWKDNYGYLLESKAIIDLED